MLEGLDLFFHTLFSVRKYSLQLLQEGQCLQWSVLLGALISSASAGSRRQDASK